LVHNYFDNQIFTLIHLNNHFAIGMGGARGPGRTLRIPRSSTLQPAPAPSATAQGIAHCLHPSRFEPFLTLAVEFRSRNPA
jgi:hypothetical protein